MNYRVKPGDTLSKIAKTVYDDATLYTLIQKANGLDDPNKIYVDQTLIIPDKPEPAAEVPDETTSSETVLTVALLRQIMPNITAANAEKYVEPLASAMSEVNIDTPLRQAHFIAQIAHESGSFRYVEENLNYSESALNAVFGKYFNAGNPAADYARQPEKIANCVYADRMGNGDQGSGEGWKFRGRGLIQLTGKSNYEAFADFCDQDLLNNPALVASDPLLAVSTATWYWQSRDLNRYADTDDITGVTKRINGGTNGLDDRKAFLERAKEAFGIA